MIAQYGHLFITLTLIRSRNGWKYFRRCDGPTSRATAARFGAARKLKNEIRRRPARFSVETRLRCKKKVKHGRGGRLRVARKIARCLSRSRRSSRTEIPFLVARSTFDHNFLGKISKPCTGTLASDERRRSLSLREGGVSRRVQRSVKFPPFVTPTTNATRLLLPASNLDTLITARFQPGSLFARAVNPERM